MSVWQSIILGIVQGLTEFLPISSTAHLRITPALLGWEKGAGLAFDTVIQMGTLVAIIWYFRKDILQLFGGLRKDVSARKLASNPESRIAWYIALGTVPVVVIGLLLKKRIEDQFRNLYYMAGFIAFFAVVLFIAEMVARRRARAGNPGRTTDKVTLKDVMLMGFFQACALLPGASRSGTTISGALFAGLERGAAARFSFLLSLPALFGAGMYQLVKAREQLFASREQIVNLAVATLVSGIVGYFSIAWLLGFLKKNSTVGFVVYRLLLAALLLILLEQGRIPADEQL